MKTSQEILETFAGYIGRYIADMSIPAFTAWVRPDRVIISVNPANVKSIGALSRDSVSHDVSTLLGGVPVISSNSTGIYFQIGYVRKEKVYRLESRRLNLAEQPTPTSVPIGVTTSGPIWLSLEELDSVLIGGTRRMGKTYLLHSWITALIAGGRSLIFLWDGKGGVEFGRYSDSTNVTIIDDLESEFPKIRLEIERRKQLFASAGVTNIEDWNRGVSVRMEAIALIIDEAAFIPETAAGYLGELIAVGGAFGVYPIIATQRTGVTEVPAIIKTNLATRISFAVPSVSDSMMILGRPGAEKISKTRGRLIFTHNARLLEAQTFGVNIGAAATPPFPAGSDRQYFLRAINETGGRMSIPLMREWGLSEWRARRLLDDYQSAGWLVPGEQNTRVISESVILRLDSQPLNLSQPVSTGLKLAETAE